MRKIDINNRDFYEFDVVRNFRTKKRLEQLVACKFTEVGMAEFGIDGVMSGLYIERVWGMSTRDWNDYIEWALSLKELKLKNK